MTLLLADSGTVQILLATGVGVFALVVGGGAIYASLGTEDRGKLRELVRHPVRGVYGEDDAADELED